MHFRIPDTLIAALVLHGLCTVATASVALGDTFGMYAYGNDITGLPIFYRDGAAVIADFATANASEDLVPVTFTASAGALKGGFVFSASPNLTAPVRNSATSEPPFSQARWSVPARGSSSREVEFVSGPEVQSGLVAQGFQLFTHQVMLQESTGKVLESLYCAFPTGSPGVWSLSWNATGAKAGGVRVVLRDSPPPPGVRYTVVEGQTCGHTS